MVTEVTITWLDGKEKKVERDEEKKKVTQELLVTYDSLPYGFTSESAKINLARIAAIQKIEEEKYQEKLNSMEKIWLIELINKLREMIKNQKELIAAKDLKIDELRRTMGKKQPH